MKMTSLFQVLSLLLLGVLHLRSVLTIDFISQSNPLSSKQNLSSPGDNFELGLFAPNGSSNRYVGIWYKKLQPRTVVWVANREKPVTDAAASLKIGNDGNLVLVDSKQNIFWSTNLTQTSNSSTAELLDSGNFVLKDGMSGEVVWQSFDHPCDTWLRNSSLSYDPISGLNKVLVSWKTCTDPSPGEFSFGLTSDVPPQASIRKGSTTYWRSGLWDKTRFVGVPDMDASYVSITNLNIDLNTGFVTYNFISSAPLDWNFLLTPNGSLKAMSNDGNRWYARWDSYQNPCDLYGACGPFSVCTNSKHESPVCRCLKGYESKSEQEWRTGNWTSGCVRKNKWLCEKNETVITSSSKGADRFHRVTGVKIPDFHQLITTVNETVCREECLSNCSCSAYALVSSGIGCLVWTSPLIDMVKLGEEDLFIRLSQREFDDEAASRKRTASLITISIFIALVAIAFAIWRRSRKRTAFVSSIAGMDPPNASNLAHFDYRSILAATDNFSMANKLGQGGFGAVYKGTLKDGMEVAVKRLSSSSWQGVDEFKNELMLISKLQHRNLVRLLGYCIEKEERLLIYENMVNKSLDGFLFDPTRKTVLNWPKRFSIIQGIARGLLYLHRDSCLRVIHRDLKVSNILLDEKMNPKISDFGLARIFEATQDLANTRRVVGTLGYMSPEYALGGIFSEKSDVFSFGILMLEIISGKKTTSFKHDDDETLGLFCLAWQSWRMSKGLTFVDESLGDSYSSEEVMRCINIALLCVQDHGVDRPTMSWVVFMMNSEAELPEPKQPTFAVQKVSNQGEQWQWRNTSFSICDDTESMIMGR